MTDSNDIAAPTPTANTPQRVKWVAGIGIPVSLVAAAAVSFAGLTELGGYAGIQHPWLMPVAIDVYATTSTLIAMLLPEDHHARSTAVWHARLGLAMSMGGNATARALHLGASGSVATFSGALLTFVGAWPSLIVERLLHLQGKLAVSVAEGAAATATPETATLPEVIEETGGETAQETGNTAPPATPPAVAPPATPPVPRVANRPATPRVATATPRHTAAAGNSVTRLTTSAEKEAIVAKLLDEHGDDYSLTAIATAIGTIHRATAMKVRDRVINARAKTQADAEDGADDPELVAAVTA